jgi:multidrug efflux pump subunit AcrA (membrane-fusion protein)
VKALKKHLDVLGDGVVSLDIVDAELTEEAIAAVQNAYRAVSNEAVQLRAYGVEASNVEASATRIQDLLAAERPWRDIGSVATDIDEIRNAYRAERRALLEEQAAQVEAARASIKQREGFALLSGDKSNRVLKPFATVMVDTTPEAIAPSLTELRMAFESRLPRAIDDANDALDELRSEGASTIVRPVELPGRNREIATEADVDAYLAEVRTLLLEYVRGGTRVRIR